MAGKGEPEYSARARALVKRIGKRAEKAKTHAAESKQARREFLAALLPDLIDGVLDKDSAIVDDVEEALVEAALEDTLAGGAE